MLIGKATRADVDPLTLPPSATADPRGNSVGRLERDGGILLNRLGVVNDIIGVVRESLLTVVVLECEDEVTDELVVTSEDELEELGCKRITGGGEVGAYISIFSLLH